MQVHVAAGHEPPLPPHPVLFAASALVSTSMTRRLILDASISALHAGVSVSSAPPWILTPMPGMFSSSLSSLGVKDACRVGTVAARVSSGGPSAPGRPSMPLLRDQSITPSLGCRPAHCQRSHLHGTPASDHVHVRHGAAAQRAQRVLCDVRRCQPLRGLQQDARAVERHVAQPHDGHAAHAAQLDGQAGLGGVAVVPPHELSR